MEQFEALSSTGSTGKCLLQKSCSDSVTLEKAKQWREESLAVGLLSSVPRTHAEVQFRLQTGKRLPPSALFELVL